MGYILKHSNLFWYFSLSNASSLWSEVCTLLWQFINDNFKVLLLPFNLFTFFCGNHSLLCLLLGSGMVKLRAVLDYWFSTNQYFHALLIRHCPKRSTPQITVFFKCRLWNTVSMKSNDINPDTLMVDYTPLVWRMLYLAGVTNNCTQIRKQIAGIKTIAQDC